MLVRPTSLLQFQIKNVGKSVLCGLNLFKKKNRNFGIIDDLQLDEDIFCILDTEIQGYLLETIIVE